MRPARELSGGGPAAGGSIGIDLPGNLAGRRRIGLQDRAFHLLAGGGRRGEWTCAGQQLEQQHAQRVDVNGGRGRMTEDLLRRRVQRRQQPVAVLGQGLRGIGRASWRERVWQYVSSWVGA